MQNHPRPALFTLDNLIEAAFDRASLVTSSEKIAAEMASRTVARWLARTGRVDLVRLLGSSTSGSVARPVTKSGVLQARAA